MTTVNQEEIQKFSKLAEEWWDVSGKFKPLHMFNPIRIEYIVENIKLHFNINNNKNNFLKKVSDKGIEIHARSIFLQGLLLQDGNKIPEEFSKFEKFFKKSENWLKLSNLNSLEACIMYTNLISEVTKIVVGINSAVQLKEIIKYKNKNIKFEIPKWQNTIDKELIDPRKWKKKH